MPDTMDVNEKKVEKKSLEVSHCSVGRIGELHSGRVGVPKGWLQDS
jgi:hypothetical protein